MAVPASSRPISGPVVRPDAPSPLATKIINGLSYSKMMFGLKQANIEVNRKMLADLAVNDADAFKAFADAAKKAL